MSTRRALIELLADGRFHSGEELARELKVSRSAVWKSMKRLEDMGLEVHATTWQAAAIGSRPLLSC